jgi:hypothetical protein
MGFFAQAAALDSGSGRAGHNAAMRVGVLVLLGILLLVVLWWRGDGPAAPSAAMAESVASQEPALPAVRSDVDLQPRAYREPVSADPMSGVMLHGRLLDPSGRGVRGIVLLFEQPLTAGGEWQRPGRITTAEGGAFTADLRTGCRYGLVGTAEGFTGSDMQVFDVTDAAPLAETRLLLQKRLDIRGKITDESGAPCAPGDLFLDVPRPIDAMLPLPWLESRRSQWKTRSAEDGSFAFPVVSEGQGRYRLVYRPADQPVFTQWKDIRAREEPWSLVARGDDLRTGLVAGTVRAADGSACARYWIQVDGRFWNEVNDAAGRFDVRAQWGCEAPILVRASRAACPQSLGTCRIDRDTQHLALQLQPTGALVVHVTGSEGAAVRQATIDLTPDQWAERGGAKWRPLCVVGFEHESDAQGEARLDEVGPGPWLVHASNLLEGRRWTDVPVTVRAGETQSIDVVLAPR